MKQRRIFGTKKEEVKGGGDCILRRFLICTLDQILFG